eukprot:NODE_11729_length_538_cov_33.672289_g11441_i0.p2 GENE.NODE_11729_length_538_cov_33.672289_g11441_i0~~NODE_11729_length_538_cov_33.672289_g11441_i0.p2  ORF type:complete len:157 (+),score=17.46 NODE_11729_length_538_cov_33.672289_g11441_i0:58-471(+)
MNARTWLLSMVLLMRNTRAVLEGPRNIVPGTGHATPKQVIPDSEASPEAHEELPALPPLDEASRHEYDERKVIQVDGQPITLDSLGPMVVNTDGSLSRITNWPEMTEIERKNTLRILAKRNKERLATVRAAKDVDEL